MNEATSQREDRPHGKKILFIFSHKYFNQIITQSCIYTHTTIYKYVSICTKTRKEYTEKICVRILGFCFF